MLVREYKVLGNGDLNNIIDLLEVRLQVSNDKFKYRYVDTIQLITGSRLVIITTIDNDYGVYSLIEITTDKVINLCKFNSLLEMDVYVLNRFWINLNSHNFIDTPVRNHIKYDVSYIRGLIKKAYRESNGWWNRILETREDIDLSDVKYYDSPYIRYGNIIKANGELKELCNSDISNIYKIDNNKFLVKVDNDSFKYAVYVDGDLYVGMYDFKLDDEFVKRLLVDARSLLKGVFNKALDKAYGIADEYRSIMIHQTDTSFIMSYDNSKVVYNKLTNGSLKFKINNKDRGIEDC